MDRPVSGTGAEQERIVLSLLNSLDDGAQSQRRIAADLGIALGLVNAYLKRCIKKGLIKVQTAPARRYGYYLTPQGFAEKSRLTVEYLSHSFSFFREAKADCTRAFAIAKDRGFQSLALFGKSDLAEIAILSAVDSGIEIIAIIDAGPGNSLFVGKPVVANFDDLSVPVDAVMITDLVKASAAFEAATAHYGTDHVLVPRLLGLQPSERSEREQ